MEIAPNNPAEIKRALIRLIAITGGLSYWAYPDFYHGYMPPPSNAYDVFVEFSAITGLICGILAMTNVNKPLKFQEILFLIIFTITTSIPAFFLVLSYVLLIISMVFYGK